MLAIELTQEEVLRYKGAVALDAEAECTSPFIGNEAISACCDFLKKRKLLGIPVKVTVTFTGGYGPNLYELWWSYGGANPTVG